MVDSQKRCPSERDNICPSFSSTSFKLTIPQFHYMTVKSLGFLLDSTLSMENFIRPCQISKSCYYQLRRICTEATVKLVTSPILSRLDCCSSFLSGLPIFSVHSLSSIQNCAARLILRERGEKQINTHTHTHTHTPVSYTHLTLPTRRGV